VITLLFSRVMVPPHGVEPRTYWLQINKQKQFPFINYWYYLLLDSRQVASAIITSISLHLIISLSYYSTTALTVYATYKILLITN